MIWLLRAIVLAIGGTFLGLMLLLLVPVAFYFTRPAQRLPTPNQIPEVVRFPSTEETQKAWEDVWRKLRHLHLIIFFCAGLPVFLAVMVVSGSGWALLEASCIGPQPFLSHLLKPVTLILSSLAGRQVIVWSLNRRATFLLREHLVRIGQAICVPCGYDLTGNVSGVCPECGSPTTIR
jgi:hypothetical protein